MQTEELKNQLDQLERQAKQLYAAIPQFAKAAMPALAGDARALLKRISNLREQVGG